VMYSQYWLQSNVNKYFNKHLEMNKKIYCQPKMVGIDVQVFQMLSTTFLDI